MPISIHEPVSVALISSHLRHDAVPHVMYWRNRRYRITKVGLHHALREGRKLMHVYSVTDGSTFFRLLFDTETLQWFLEELEHE